MSLYFRFLTPERTVRIFRGERESVSFQSLIGIEDAPRCGDSELRIAAVAA